MDADGLTGLEGKNRVLWSTWARRSAFLKILALIVCVTCMTGIDLCCFLGDGSTIKRYAGLTWIAIAVAAFWSAFMFAFAHLVKSAVWRESGMGWYLTALVLPFFLVYWGISGIEWTPVDGEGVQQTTVGINLLKHDPSFGVFSSGYYDRYVARQYVLMALPSVTFGPSLLALRLGNSFIYLISYAAFLAGLYWYLKSRQVNALFWSAWTGVAFALGQYPLIEARGFEQVSMPLGATLMFLASLLYFLAQPSPLRVIWIAWSMSFLTCGYTPAYGTWALAMVILGYLAFAPGFRHRLLLFPAAQGAVSFLVAYLILKHAGSLDNCISKVGDPHMTIHDWLWRFFCGFTAEFNAGFSVIPAPLGVVSAAVLFLSLAKREYRVWAIALWCAGVVLASLTLDGSNFDTPHYDVQRSMIILPFLSLGSLLYYLRYYGDHAYAPFVEKLALCSILYMVYTGFSFPMLQRHYLSDDNVVYDTDEAFVRLAELGRDGQPVAKLYVDPSMNMDEWALQNDLDYLFPGATVSHDAPATAFGAYFMHYNSTPRDWDERWPDHNARPYIAVERTWPAAVTLGAWKK